MRHVSCMCVVVVFFSLLSYICRVHSTHMCTLISSHFRRKIQLCTGLRYENRNTIKVFFINLILTISNMSFVSLWFCCFFFLLCFYFRSFCSVNEISKIHLLHLFPQHVVNVSGYVVSESCEFNASLDL